VTVSDPEPAPGRAPQVFGNVPQRNNNFTGREDILALLRKDLANSVTVVIPHALQGLGGVGKTQVAIEYAYRYSENYDLIWWIPADQPPLVRASLAGLAERLNLPSAESSGIAGAAAEALDALRRGFPFGRWLLIFDNADQPDDLDDVLPRGGPGHILVTSRNYRWQTRAEIVEVDVFTPAESLEFLKRRVRGELDSQAAHALATELGHLPLALEQAGALQSEAGMSAEEYLLLLKEHAAAVMAEGKSADYPLPMTIAWRLSISRLEQHQPEALTLLRCCAFFGPEPIPREILPRSAYALQPPIRDLLADPIRLARAIRELTRFGLVRIDGRTMIIHRLSQALLRDELPVEEQRHYRDIAHLMLAAGAPQDPDDSKLWLRYAELVAHVAAPEVHIEQSRVETVRCFAADMIRYLYKSGDLEAARLLAEWLIDQWSPYIPESDPQLLRAQRQLANVLRGLGQYDDAYRVDGTTLVIATRTVGERDPFTLAVANSFAADLRAKGDFEVALDLDLRSFEVHKQVMGQEHPQTLRAANNLALDYELNSRYQEARALHKETYRIRTERSSDIPAQDLVSSWSGLSRALRLCGNYSAARDVGRDAYDYSVAALGPEHPRTIETAIDLLHALRRVAVSRHDTADFARQVYEQARQRFGQLAPLTLASIVSLTNIQRMSGEIVDALTLNEVAAQLYGALYGAHHPYYFGCLGNVALLHRINGDSRRARELNEEALTGLDARLGRNHYYTLTVALNLASDLAGVGDVNGARALGESSLRRLRALLGEQHPLTLGCAANLAADLSSAGDPVAEELFAATVEGYLRTIGDDHPDAIVAAAGHRVDFDFDSQQI
jgi:hypothetical protein